MASLVWIGLIVAGIVGLLVGSAISREYRRPLLLRAERAEAALAQLQRDFLEEIPVERAPIEVPAAAQPAPVVVHVHIPSMYPAWQSPVIDAQVIPALEGPR